MLKNKIKFYIDKFTQITGIDFHYVLKGGSWSVLDQVISNVGAFIQAIAFARLIPQAAYGTYSLIQTWVEIFAVFAISGLPYAVTKSVAQGFEGELQRGVQYKLRYGLISSLIALGFTLYYLQMGNNMFALSFLIVSIFLPFSLISKILYNFLRAKGLFSKIPLVNSVVTSVSVAVMIIVLFNTSYVPYILLAYFIPSSLAYFIFLFWIIKKYQNNRKVSAETKRFGMHLTFMNIAGVIVKRIDQLLMFHLVGPVELAIYKFALLPIRKLQGLVEIVPEIALPRFAKRSYPEIYSAIGRKLLFATLAGVFIVIGYITILPWAYRFFFPAYVGSVKYSIILALPIVFVMFSFINYIWLAKVEVKRLYFLKVLNDFSLLGFFIILIPKFGLWGAVVSRIATSTIVSLITLTLFLKDKKKYTSI